MRHFVLYSSKDCCLCDDALILVDTLKQEGEFEDGIQLEKFDIYTDKSALLKYRFTIPVLRNTETGAELAWPFNYEQLKEWIG
jgi:hypothetical protein